MHKSYFERVIAAALIVLLPAAIMSADASSAVLSAGDKVLVNGKEASVRQAILPGDNVKNVGNGSAILALPGGSVTVAKNSSVSYGSGEVRVTAGAASVANNEISAKFEEVSVRPSSKDARYVVGEVDGKRIVAALHGSILVSDGMNEVLLRQGSAMTQDRVPQPPAQGAGVGTDTKRKTSEEPRGGKRRRAAALPGWVEVALIGGAIGGLIGGLALAGRFDDKTDVSRVTP